MRFEWEVPMRQSLVKGYGIFIKGVVLFSGLFFSFGSFAQQSNGPLLKAVKKGQMERVELFLQKGVAVNATNAKGDTPLMIAADKGNLGLVRLLLRYGADVSLTNKKGETVIDKARKKKSAPQLIATLELAEVIKQDSIPAYRKFSDQHQQYAGMVEDYLVAKQAHTIEGFEAFISKHPDSLFQAAIEMTLSDLYFEAAKKKNTREGYREFLEKDKTKRYLSEIQSAIHDLEFRAAVESQSIDVVSNFLSEHKDSPHFEKVLMRLVELKYEEGRNYTFNRFLRSYRRSPYKEAIDKKVLELKYRKALGSESKYEMTRFIKEHPQTEYAERVKTALEELEYKGVKLGQSTFKMKNFLDSFPGSKYASEIQSLLEPALYEEITKRKSYRGHQDFLKRFPDSQYSGQLKTELYDLHFVHVKRENKLEDYQDFLRAYKETQDRQEIESLIACKKDDLQSYQDFLEKYPKSAFRDKIEFQMALKEPSIAVFEAYREKHPQSKYAKLAQNKINDIVFSKGLPELLTLMETNNFEDRVLIEKIDNLCLTPPATISYQQVKLFQKAMATKLETFKKEEESKNTSGTHIIYPIVELFYYVSVAMARNSMNIMLENVSHGSMVKVDLFKITEGVNHFLQIQLALMLIDKDPANRNRALLGLHRITENNSLALSRKWTQGEELRGIEIIAGGVPIRLDTLKATLKEIAKSETNKPNLELIKGIQEKLAAP